MLRVQLTFRLDTLFTLSCIVYHLATVYCIHSLIYIVPYDLLNLRFLPYIAASTS